MTTNTTTGWPTKDKLLENMQLGASTNNWDIVCSYSEDKFNALLQNQYKKGALVDEVSFQKDVKDPFLGENFTIKYDLFLGAPLLKFLAEKEPKCQLTMSLKGSYTIVGATTTTHDISNKGYSLVVAVPLSTIDADTQETQTSNSVVEFKKADQQNSIFIHFKEKDTLFTISPVPDKDDNMAMENYFLPNIKYYFQDNVNEIEYALTTVTNTESDKGDIVIVPKSFRFATAKYNDSDTAVLSIYIQTKNSGYDKGNAEPSFQPGDNQTYPIPQGFTASLIFSRDFIEKVLFTPQIIQLFEEPVYNNDQDSDISFTAVYKISPEDTKNPTKLKIAERRKNVKGGGQTVVDAFTIDFADYPFTFDFKYDKDKKTDKVAISFKISKKEVDWDWSDTDGESQEGSITINVTLDKEYTLNKAPSDATKKKSVASIDDKTLNIDFAVSKDDYSYDLDYSVEGGDWGFSVVHFKNDVKNALKKDLHSIIPAIAFNLDSINYFSVTNLLFPGQDIFLVDNTEGVHFPSDMLILGNVTDESS